ncbi:MAG TPA: CopG family transcriptional regulator [Terriglobia bacterium]|nr:CopG family transcriptional regulator [Terriglobia bacterium]
MNRKQVKALDKLAQRQDRDRTHLLNEAVSVYLEIQEWQIEQIRKGIREADAGQAVPHEEVVAYWDRKFKER